jgi:predicted DCC family thiol-disulfide oxidoreductase YuxK
VTATPASDTAVLLYDGQCGFCAGSVQLVLNHESPAARTQLRFAPLQGAFGTALTARFPELRGVDSVVWYDPAAERVQVRSAAALAVTRHLGGAWAALGALAGVLPRGLRDWVYDRIAKQRMTLAAPSCLLPTPEQRARFLP